MTGTLRPLLKLTRVELKLFAREPVTLFFALALPVLFFLVLAEVFGNTPDTADDGVVAFRGLGPTDYYVVADMAIVIASIGLIALPVHLASYRERGVLRRLRASSVPVLSLVGAHIAVSLVVAAAGSILLIVAGVAVYDVRLAGAPGLVAAAFVVSTVGFAALGVLLGALLPTARAAQGVGLVLFFVMMFLSGAGPPRDVMSDTLHRVGDFSPLTYVVELMQDPWFDLGWNYVAFLVIGAMLLGAAVLSALRLRE